MSQLNTYEQLHKVAEHQENLAIKAMTDLVENFDIVKSDISDFFFNLIDNYRFFLSTLSSEQMVIVFNLLGYMLLMSTLSTIVSILIGDQIINNLNLEKNYPKLAKYIKYKQTLNKYSLRFNIVFFYFLLILLMSVNIFMFFFDARAQYFL